MIDFTQSTIAQVPQMSYAVISFPSELKNMMRLVLIEYTKIVE